MPRAAKAQALLTVLLLTGTVLFLVFGVNALPTGITRELAGSEDVNLGADGCSCHAKEGPYPEVLINHTIPAVFEAGQQYTIWVNFTGGPPMATTANAYTGGFNVLVTEGKLTPVAEGDQADYVQNLGVPDREITHTTEGARNAARSFQFIWDSTGAGNAATFVILVNAVDGNNAANDADLWNRMVVSTVAKGQAPENVIGGAAEHVSFHKLGINRLAYWVGVISFAVLFIIYGATFFLFKYGESNATTDHHDRPGAATEDFTGAPIRQNKLVLLILVAAIAVALVIFLLYQRGAFNA